MPQPHASQECVLIVDDDEDTRDSLCDVVKVLGCSSLSAASGQDAIRILAEHRPCLVILDLVMQGMSGLQVLDLMRRDPQLASVPVVISTSAHHRVPADVPTLPKPVNIDTLHACLSRSCQCKHELAAMPG